MENLNIYLILMVKVLRVRNYYRDVIVVGWF